jgi:hypothetical protein
MISQRIEGGNVELAKDQPEYNNLVARYSFQPFGPTWTTAWELTPDELERLNAGASVELSIISVNHPPVYLTVGKVPSK